MAYRYISHTSGRMRVSRWGGGCGQEREEKKQNKTLKGLLLHPEPHQLSLNNDFIVIFHCTFERNEYIYYWNKNGSCV